MTLNCPYKLKSVVFQRKYPGYIYRREIIDDSQYGGDGSLEMVNCYSDKTGIWLGNAKDARNLCKKRGIRQIETHKGRTIGFNPDSQKWYGWSHRAICGFGVGDEYQDMKIENLSDAKDAAVMFSRFVS